MLATDADVLDYLRTCGLSVSAAMQRQIPLARACVERMVKEYVGYFVEQGTYVEYHPEGRGNLKADGDASSLGFDLMGGAVVPRDISRVGREEMVLRQLPVRSVVSIYDNPGAWNVAGGSWPEFSLLPPQTYFIDAPGVEVAGDPETFCWSGIVYRATGSWSRTQRGIKVTYVGGLTTDELRTVVPEFRMAVMLGCAKLVGDAVARGRAAVLGAVPSAVSIEDFSVSFGPMNQVLGSFAGAGLGSVALPTECMQMLRHRVHMAKYF